MISTMSTTVFITTLLLSFVIIINGDKCNPSPCGPNTECKVISQIPTCYCKPTYIGDDPIGEGCMHECETANDCESSKKCHEYKCVECTENKECPTEIPVCFVHSCVDICKEVKCGEGSKCKITPDGQALCYCPKNTKGDPFIKCS